MNSEIEIVDFSEKYISDVLNVLYESNILHIKSCLLYTSDAADE